MVTLFRMVSHIRFNVLLRNMLVLTLLTGSVHAQTPASARALESRLWAPCCYGGTLDTHVSPLSTELRTEIETRLRAGETPDAIQTDFVARYGDKVIAARSDGAIRAMTVGGALAVIAAAIALALLMRRWRTPHDAPPLKITGEPADLDARLDAELAELDG